jgi:hypothetical protein
MAAFKAANPTSPLEDFVRWHSPRDWSAEGLSARMASAGNLWQATWEETAPLAAARQRPLFDAESFLSFLFFYFLQERQRLCSMRCMNSFFLIYFI